MSSVTTTSETKTRAPDTRLPSGAKSYSGWRLAIYDRWVLGVVNTYAWKCPTSTRLLPPFRDNIRASHLDIGVGTGWYLEHANISPDTMVMLCDLSPSALEAAKARLQDQIDVRTLQADILQPLPIKNRFDSASMFFLVHCLPGPVQNKTIIFDHIRHNLTPNGVLTGATVLGPHRGWVDKWFGSLIRYFVNKDGIMDNKTDNPETLIAALHRNFESGRGCGHSSDLEGGAS